MPSGNLAHQIKYHTVTNYNMFTVLHHSNKEVGTSRVEVIFRGCNYLKIVLKMYQICYFVTKLRKEGGGVSG